jgi:hypothetical protein
MGRHAKIGPQRDRAILDGLLDEINSKFNSHPISKDQFRTALKDYFMI